MQRAATQGLLRENDIHVVHAPRQTGYTWRLYERYRLPVYPVVVVLRPGVS